MLRKSIYIISSVLRGIGATTFPTYTNLKHLLYYTYSLTTKRYILERLSKIIGRVLKVDDVLGVV